ncbi:hypothetical protein [Sulfolobus super-elliptical virus]|nr:hypothetical protein [Sulfolobus super-elliptical virus]
MYIMFELNVLLADFGIFAIVFFISYAFLRNKVNNPFKYSIYLAVYGFFSLFLIFVLGTIGLIIVLISIIFALILTIRRLKK